MHLDEWCDTEDIGIYPITINTFRMDMGASAKGEAFEIHVPAFEACYNSNYGSIHNIKENSGSVNIYPNPVNTGQTVSVTVEGKANASVYDIKGRCVYHIIGENKIYLNTNNLQKGLYLIRIISENNQYISKLIIL